MYTKIIEELTKLEHEHFALSDSYESNGSYEMSYMALWTILEHILKPIASEGMKKKLQRSLHEWIDHLESPVSGKKPKDIKSFKTEYSSTSIPPISLIEEAIGDVPKLKVLMDSNGKYRKKRNSIAHRAEKLSKSIYSDYKSTVILALEELRVVLQSHTERT
ncbi:hypothetical protein L7E62_004686 [Vibrio parahaemolyticus]|nr:hypothetical protein [Vibrio parahaemolyticus]EIV8661109.1 hypothetical protein [Vibrio parahaemolyticus]MBE5150939.1 hypothetical protein [Vibrio parahaemolyticus]